MGQIVHLSNGLLLHLNAVLLLELLDEPAILTLACQSFVGILEKTYGSLIAGVMGARIPFSLMEPFRTCLTATAQGTPTSLAMAE